MGADRLPAGGNPVGVFDTVIYGDDARVIEWVRARIPGMMVHGGETALGVVRDDTLVAGVVFEQHNGPHILASIAAETGTGWASRGALRRLFEYPFDQLGCLAISVLVPVTNLASLNLATKLGFWPEAMIRFAAPDGSTLIVLKMLREQCRWIGHG